MSRCRSCNKILSEGEMIGTLEDGSPEDTCYVCKGKAFEEWSYIKDKEYNHHDLQEGLCASKNYNE